MYQVCRLCREGFGTVLCTVRVCVFADEPPANDGDHVSGCDINRANTGSVACLVRFSIFALSLSLALYVSVNSVDFYSIFGDLGSPVPLSTSALYGSSSKSSSGSSALIVLHTSTRH